MSCRLLIASLFLIAVLVCTSAANAHYRPGVHNQEHAIIWAFCGHQYRILCGHGLGAIVVSRQESAHYWYTGCADARNGQYRGCFQMGDWERRNYGHGNNPWAQAAAAYRYFRATGSDWSPWSCKPQGYCIN